MFQKISYELHALQMHKLKKNFPSFSKIEFNVAPKINLHGLEIHPNLETYKFPCAILLHGYTSNYRHLSHIANLFLSRGIGVILVNLRGHGKSTGKKSDIRGMQSDIDKILKYVKSQEVYDLSKILLLGISLGALITLTAGYHHLDITHLIALAGMSSPLDLLEGMSAFRRWRWNIIGKMGGIDISSMVGKLRFSPKLQPQTCNIPKKILLLHCKNDALVGINNFNNNVEAFNLKSEDQFTFSKGAHSFFFVKNHVVRVIHTWLKNNHFYRAE